eukprot:TRINITY_DN37555_c0_g1_i1.p1 TRINITY_DN37555_c0_g1~~TRINITY_DN37555_c0_g1_i1.p1  ORF type:complete len:498 (+),score=86.93 TRINITY_DN37555_c0_g1_i1:239-1732(+)
MAASRAVRFAGVLRPSAPLFVWTESSSFGLSHLKDAHAEDNLENSRLPGGGDHYHGALSNTSVSGTFAWDNHGLFDRNTAQMATHRKTPPTGTPLSPSYWNMDRVNLDPTATTDRFAGIIDREGMNQASNAPLANDFYRGQSYRHWRKYNALPGDYTHGVAPNRRDLMRRYTDMPKLKRKRIEAGQLGYSQPQTWGADGTLPLTRIHWETRPGRRLMNALYRYYAEPYNQHRPVVRIGLFGWPGFSYHSIIAHSVVLAGRVSLETRVAIFEHVTVIAHSDNIIHSCLGLVLMDHVQVSTLPWRRAEAGPDDPSLGDVIFGDMVFVDTGAKIHASVLDGYNYVGQNAVLDHCYLERYAFVADGSVVPPGRRIPSGELWGGKPARFLRKVFPWEKVGIEDWIDYAWENAWTLYREYETDWPGGLYEKEALEDWFNDTVEKHLEDDEVPAQARYTLTHRPRIEEEFWYQMMMEDYVPSNKTQYPYSRGFGVPGSSGRLLL